MAKKDNVKDALSELVAGGKRAEIPQAKKKNPVLSYGIGLRDSEWSQFDLIAAELGMNRHRVAAWALRRFLKQYEAGEIETVTKKTLPGL